MIDKIFLRLYLHTHTQHSVAYALSSVLRRFAVLRFVFFFFLFLFIRFYLVKLECIIFFGVSHSFSFYSIFSALLYMYMHIGMCLVYYEYEGSCFILFYVKLIGLFYVFVIEIPRFYSAFLVLCRF